MSKCIVHEHHEHEHNTNCGHTAIKHNDHTDYIHDGHLHSLHDNHIDEHSLNIDETNPGSCTSGHDCSSHETDHTHGLNCGHEAVPHSDHTDYIVDGHLHHPHEGHCDNHGPVEVL